MALNPDIVPLVINGVGGDLAPAVEYVLLDHDEQVCVWHLPPATRCAVLLSSH